MVGAISLFSGAGGLDIGAKMAGVDVLLSTDIEADCIATLRANKNWHTGEIIERDLHEVESEELSELSKVKSDKLIVIGGAPCQPFSKNGYWVGNNVRRGIDDPRAKLVNEFLRVVTDIQPDGFLFENVESLLHPTNKVIVDGFLRIIIESGYSYKIVKAAALDYGVPQNRRRLFIIGTKGSFKSESPQKTHGSEKDIKKDKTLRPYATTGEFISKYDIADFFEPEEVVKGRYEEDLREVPPGMNYKALTAWAGYPNPKFEADKKFWNFLLKLSPNRYSWTITAQPGPWIGPFHWNSRRLRVPEIAAIQTFPEDYTFVGSRSSKQKQIGNAVPAFMAKAMVEYLKASIE